MLLAELASYASADVICMQVGPELDAISDARNAIDCLI
jgi:hypothetical protein